MDHPPPLVITRRAGPGRPARAAAALATLAVAAASLVGCNDLERFSTASDEAYCGSVTLGSAFRAGLSQRVQMRLHLDAAALEGASNAGTITTYEAADAKHAERRMLDETALRPITAMQHDPLSRLEFGEGRERNAIFAVSPADPGAESMLAVVSLQSDDTVEVRLVRGGSPELPDLPEGRRAIFGVFLLSRQKGQCGF